MAEVNGVTNVCLIVFADQLMVWNRKSCVNGRSINEVLTGLVLKLLKDVAQFLNRIVVGTDIGEELNNR